MMANTNKMRNYRAWAKDKPPFLAIIALSIASFSEECFILFEVVRKGKRIEGDMPLPSLRKWLNLYRNPKRVGRVLLNDFKKIDNPETVNIIKFNQNMWNGSQQLKKMSQEEYEKEFNKMSQEEKEDIIKDVYEVLKGEQEYIINDLVNEPSDEERRIIKETFTKPEMIFLLRVMAPCLMLYGMYPIDLLKKAQKGDEDAIEKLIRLDKSIIFDRKISEIIHQAQAAKAQKRMSLIKKAFNSQPRVKITRQKIKCNLGGLISYISESTMKVIKTEVKRKLKLKKITAPEIHDLFDAIAYDMGKGGADPDLICSKEAFAKAVKRSEKFWKFILIPDKK